MNTATSRRTTSRPTLSPIQFKVQKPGWVKLRDQMTPFSFDEALLLCEEPEGDWIAWVPDFGEVRLSPDQFE